MSEPEWLVEGGKCFAYNYTAVYRRTIKKLTKTQVVLDNDERFNRSRLSKSTGSTWDGARWELRGPDDAEILRLVEQQSLLGIRRRAANTVEDLMVEWRKADGPSTDAAERAVGVLVAAIAQLRGGAA